MARRIGSPKVRLGRALTGLLVALAAACSDSSTIPQPPEPAYRISAAAGDGQVGLPGAELPRPLAVRVTNQSGVAVADVAVEFAAEGNGTAGRTARTNAQGLAIVSWTTASGSGSGTQVVRVRVAGDAGAMASFTIRALGSLAKVRGDGQAEAPGQELLTPPTVRLLDTDQRPIAGATVTWSVASGLGATSAATTNTNAAGESSVVWSLGPQGGPDVHSLVADVAGVATTRFTATGTLTEVRIQIVGDNRSGAPGRAVRTVAQVVNGGANPIRLVNMPIEWIVTAGGGSASPATGVTDESGYATTYWIFGDSLGPGTQRLEARLVGATAIAANVVGTTIGPPSVITISEGDTFWEAGMGGYLFAEVLDAFGSGIEGAAVAWAVVSTGPASGQFYQQTTITDGRGESFVQLTLGYAAGSLSVTATVTRPDGVNLVGRFDVTPY
ncbi:MAG: Ig-like domain-containing protein [Gemmatimonadales bacterium]